ncbi:MAG: glycosyltransferase family 4 protein [Spirosomataceae bacterium]
MKRSKQNPKEGIRILIIHQFLWAHYKAKIYTELQKVVDKHPNAELLVLQTALNEFTRANIGNIDWSIHQYNVKLLFEDFYENTTILQRVKKCIYWINQFKPNVVNVPGYYEPAMNIVLFYCRLKGIKVIISSDSSEADNPNISWRESIKSFIVRKAHGFFCYGTKSADYMLKLGATPEQILVKNNSVDNQRIAETHQVALKTREEDKKALGLKKYNFVYVGRLIKIKNLDNLLKAYNKLNTDDWGVILLGDGQELDELQAYVKEHQLSGVKFIEGKPWYDVPKYLALGDVFILPSYSEPWGLVLNEAMACEMPILVSEKCGSAIDLVDEGKNGFNFDPYDIDSMSKAMNHFIENPELIKPFGQRSKEIIRYYSPENVAQEMFDGVCKIL